MDWNTIHRTGYIASESNLSHNRRNIAATEFLEGVVKEFTRASRRYFDLTEELPFVYRERQIHSVLLPAVAKIADALLVEMPVTRKIKRHSSYGWIDYWACCQNVDLLMEVKHSWQAITSDKIRKATTTAWKKLTDQLDSLPSETKDFTLSGEPLKVALLILPCYQSSKDSTWLEPFDREITAETHKFIRSKLVIPAPNWSSIWHLHKELQISFLYDGWSEIYPCVIFMARVSPLE